MASPNGHTIVPSTDDMHVSLSGARGGRRGCRSLRHPLWSGLAVMLLVVNVLGPMCGAPVSSPPSGDQDSQVLDYDPGIPPDNTPPTNSGTTDPATGTNVEPVQPNQVTSLSAEYEVAEGQTLQLVLQANGADGNTRYIILAAPTGGTLDATGGIGLDSPVVSYTPAPGFTGDDTITFAAYDSTRVKAQGVATSQSGTVKITVYRQGILTVSPAGAMTVSGNQGGPFTPPSAVYTLSNTGGRSLNWTAAKTQSWVSLSKASGSLAAGASTTLTVAITSGANGLSAGNYSDNLTFTNTTTGGGNTTRAVNLAITPPVGCVASNTAWQNQPFVGQTGLFTAECDVTPSAAGITAHVGLSAAAGAAYSDYATLVGFGPTGYLDARDGAGYSATTSIPYTPGTSYHLRMVADVAAHTYTVYVKPAGQSELTLASNFAFRTEQAAVTSLANVGTASQTGSLQVCNFVLAVPPGTLAVSPAGGLNASGSQGGPFAPASAVYTVSNTGSQSLNWTAAKTQSWVTLSKGSGTLAAGATDTVTVTINSGCNSLAAGSYSDTVSFINATSGLGNATRPASVTVGAAPGALTITPAGGFTASGNQGGPFSPASGVYTVTNSGGQAIAWTAAKTQSWVTLSKASGTLAAGASDTVTVSLNSAANSLTAGTFTDTVTFTNTTNGTGTGTRAVSLTVNPPPGGLTVSPGGGLNSAGTAGGPFSPGTITWTLTNSGGQAINWTAAKTEPCLTLSKASGTLAAGASESVTLTINSAANSLPAGTHSDTVTFTNTTNGTGNTTRAVAIDIQAASTCATSTATWQNFAMSAQTGTFNAECDVTPSAAGITAHVGLSAAAGAAYSDYAVLVGFGPTGTLDVRNGAGYAADTSIGYTAGTTYHIRMLVNVPAHTYSVYVKTDTGTEQTLASDYAFRTEQAAVTALANWGTVSQSGALQVCNYTVSLPPGILEVASASGLAASGNQGGPFSPASVAYTLTNPGGQALNWTAAKTQSWVTLSKASGTLAAGASDTVMVSIGAGANSLAAGSYSDTVTFTNASNGTGNTTRPVTLTVVPAVGTLTVTGSGGLLSYGNQGGPFNPASVTYTLSNTGNASLNWTATKGQSWVTLSKASGTLAVGGTDTVVVSYSSGANSLVGGSYADTVTFTNTTVGTSLTRSVALHVVPALTIGASATSGTAPLVVQFTALEGSTTATHLPTGSTLNWNYGDGSSMASGVQVSHTFSSAGTCLVALTLVLPSGLGTISCNQATIQVAQNGGTETAMTTATRTSGVGPLAIFFDAVGSGTGVVQPSDGDYASYTYEWDFGDPTSGNWSNGRQNPDSSYGSKNVATGYVAMHVYENAGTYTARLKVTSSSGVVTNYRQDITVQAFSGTTYYVSSAGNDANDGLSTSTPYKTFDKAATQMKTNTRVLFKRGETFSTATGKSLSTAGPGIVGAYGSGNKPVISVTGSASAFTASGSDWRIMDLTVNGPGPVTSSGNFLPGPYGANLLLLRVDESAFSRAMISSGSTLNNLFLVDCSFTNNNTYHLYIYGTDTANARHIALAGNNYTGTADEHLVRTYMDRSLVQHCTFGQATKHQIKFCGTNKPNPAAGYTVVSDNAFLDPGTVCTWMTSWGPENTESEEYVSDLIIERNLYKAAGKLAIQSRGASKVTVRNNVFIDVSEAVNCGEPGVGASGTWANWNIMNNSVLNTAGGDFSFVNSSYPMPGVRICNNAVNTSASSSGSYVRMLDLTGTTRAQMTEGNNIYYAPNNASATLFMVSGGSYNFSAWGVSSDSQSNPAFVRQGDTLTIQSSSPACNKGVATPLAIQDIMCTPRPQGGVYDIGAWEVAQ